MVRISKTKLIIRWFLTTIGWCVTIPAGIYSLFVLFIVSLCVWITENDEKTFLTLFSKILQEFWKEYKPLVWRSEKTY